MHHNVLNGLRDLPKVITLPLLELEEGNILTYLKAGLHGCSFGHVLQQGK